MKTIAYIIGTAAATFAIFIIEMLNYQEPVVTIFTMLFFVITGLFVLKNRVSIIKPFENHNVKEVKAILKTRNLNNIFTYESRRLYELMLKVSVGEFGKAYKEYHTFTYHNELDQYKESYIYQYLFLMTNDIQKFLQLKKSYNIVRNKVIEDNIIVHLPPGAILHNGTTYKIDLTLLDDIYNLYNGSIDFDFLSRKKYKHTVYNYMKEKALYYYLTNTEQPKRRHAFWLDSNYIFDEFINEEQAGDNK